MKIKYDPLKSYGYVTYLRMSDPRQNQRSPDQQDDTIESTKKRLGYPWVRIGSYRDSGRSGKLVLRRDDFQRMLGDIRTAKIKPDLILVDTYQRYGRADELEDVRKVLELEYGVLLLTADSNFADPTTTAGRIMAVVDQIRATEDNETKGHDVMRGKLDAVRQKHWPGGPAPFGLKLDPVYHDVAGRPEFDYSKLIRDMQTDWIIHLQFQKAAETGWGQTRLTQFLNAHPDIPAQYKPFSEYTVGDRLRETLYYGEFHYPRIHKETVKDRTVVTHTSPEFVICVPDFCEPIVPIELWNAANQPRLIRAERLLLAKQEKKSAEREKLIEPTVRGIAITYLLTGLVHCGHCGRVMNAGGSSPYQLKSGEERRYVHYVCPGAPGGACPNRQRVPEEWLRQRVVSLLRQRLFGDPG